MEGHQRHTADEHPQSHDIRHVQWFRHVDHFPVSMNRYGRIELKKKSWNVGGEEDMMSLAYPFALTNSISGPPSFHTPAQSQTYMSKQNTVWSSERDEHVPGKYQVLRQQASRHLKFSNARTRCRRFEQYEQKDTDHRDHISDKQSEILLSSQTSNKTTIDQINNPSTRPLAKQD